MPDSRTQMVADGYDVIGETYAAWREAAIGDPRRKWDEVVAWASPDDPERFQWVLAQA